MVILKLILIGALIGPVPLVAGTDKSGAALADVKFDRITDQDGLSQNGILDILQDNRGLIWFATRDGLNRYDGIRFKIYYRDFNDPHTLPGNQISALDEDSHGMIWVATSESGIARLDPFTDRVTRFPATGKPEEIHNNTVDILLDRSDRVWVATQEGLYRHDPQTGLNSHIALGLAKNGDREYTTCVEEIDGLPGIWVGAYEGLTHYVDGKGVVAGYGDGPDGFHHHYVTALAPDRKGGLWVTTARGLNFLDIQTGKIQRVDMPEKLLDFAPNSLMVDHHGVVWTGTEGGLFLYQPRDGTSHQLAHEPNNPRGLSDNLVESIFEDKSGIVWVGTFTGGVNKFNRTSEMITHVRRDPNRPKGFGYNSCFGLHEDDDGNIWIGSWGYGLSRYDPNTGAFTDYGEDPNSESGLGIVFAVERADEDHLWVAAGGGLVRLNRNSGEIQSQAYQPDDEASTKYNTINDLIVDAGNIVWTGTEGGLGRFDPQQAAWTFFNGPELLPHNDVNTLITDGDHLLLGLSGSGLISFDPATGTTFNLRSAQPERPEGLSNGYILCLLADKADRIWIGTLGGGLNRYDKASGLFKRYTRKQGLANEKIFAMTSAADGRLWLASNRGIIRFDPREETAFNFDLSYNLQGNEYGRDSALTTRDGTIYLGGTNGLNIFHPDRIRPNHFQPSVLFTGFKILNEPVLLERDISTLDHLEISHTAHGITFEFAALDYMVPKKNEFNYQLEGLSDRWVPLGGEASLTIPNLNPGNYTLRIKGTNSEGLFSEKTASLQISVPPPWWRHPFAYASYVVGFFLLLGTAVRSQRKKLVRERRINQQLRQVDRLKDEFLANTSHELRTPLHGMVGLAESLLEGAAGPINNEAATSLRLMVSSGRRLENLVNDILDFAKLREQRLELALRPVDLKSLAEVVFTICQPLAQDKSLLMELAVPDEFPLLLADENRLQQILYNLIGNAVKFTEAGSVHLSASANHGQARITVQDTGIGFKPEQAALLFESFQQADGSIGREYGGTGLGLAITRELVEGHGGKIMAEAAPGKGAKFTFSIPLVDKEQVVAEATPDPALLQEVATTAPPTRSTSEVTPSAARGVREFHILAVDDEPANRQILANLLKLHEYRVTLAANGREALEQLTQHHFDMVLLDVMMPKMSGFEVCKTIRKQYSLQALPVIFLTAKTQVADMVTGFELGANDFLTKPFSKDALLSRVRPHLELMEIHRGLEQKVAERTKALKTYSEELETIDTIVKTINREMEPSGLLPAVLHQGIALFKDVTCGSILVRDQTLGFVIGNETRCSQLLGRKSYTEAEARRLFMNPGHHLNDQIFARPLTQVSVSSPPADFRAHYLVCIPCLDEAGLEGFLLLLTEKDPHDLHKFWVNRLVRFREHAVNALTRARMLRELAEKQRDLVETAHVVGMAENARMVLHHMGNSLNSINTSCDVLDRNLQTTGWSSLADKLITHLKTASDLPQVGDQDPNGSRFVKTLQSLFTRLKRRDTTISAEVARLQGHLADILHVLREQDAFTQARETPEPVEINQLIQACIIAEHRNHKDVEIQFELGRIPTMILPKIKFMHLLSSLFKNARSSIRVSGGEGAITVLSQIRGEQVAVTIKDNGHGPKNHAGRVFTQGFTAVLGQPGSDLHNCANIVREMGGDITLQQYSDPEGEEITFTLPLLPPTLA